MCSFCLCTDSKTGHYLSIRKSKEPSSSDCSRYQSLRHNPSLASAPSISDDSHNLELWRKMINAISH